MVEPAEYYLIADDEKERRQARLSAQPPALPSRIISSPLVSHQFTGQFDGNVMRPSLNSNDSIRTNFSAPTISMISSPSSRISLNSSNASKSPPQTLKWLLDNFEGSEGVSLPRATLFALYIQHCAEIDLEPMNAASFGKMIRSIFSGLRTRRLGTRGNSKYHYYGIKLKQMSNLHKRLAEVSSQGNSLPGMSSPTIERRQRSGLQRHLMSARELKNRSLSKGPYGVYEATKRGNFKAPMQCPSLSACELIADTDLKDFSEEDVTQFVSLYVEHFEASVSAINNAQFEYLCAIWNAFWRHPSIDVSNASYKIIEQRLPKSTFNSLVQHPLILNFIYSSDAQFYEKYAEYIFPSVFCPFDDLMIMNLKNVKVDIQSILASSTMHLPETVIKTKKRALDHFQSHLKDLTSLSHSIDSVRTIFKSKSCVSQAQADFQLIDGAEVKKRLKNLLPHCAHQFDAFERFLALFFGTESDSSSDCGGDEKSLNGVELEALLNQAESLVASVVSQCTAHNYNDNKSKDDPLVQLQVMREVYVNWCLFSSMILREMTLRGASSFGIFQLTRTLLDDYLFHYVKMKIAQSSGRPLICAMDDEQ